MNINLKIDKKIHIHLNFYFLIFVKNRRCFLTKKARAKSDFIIVFRWFYQKSISRFLIWLA